jgi:hypothetical protein
VKTFNPHSAHPARALQAWQILVGKAMNRQTITYEQISQLMYGKSAPGVLAAVLGHVAFYCNDHGLPALTAIVVNSVSGLPGAEIPVDDLRKLNEEREEVYMRDWYDVFPPSETELAAAFKHNTKK